MKLSFSTNAFAKVSLFEALRTIAGIGFEGVEIMADAPHVWPLEGGEAEWRRIRESAEALGLAVCNVNAFMMKRVDGIHHPSWIETDAKARSLRRAHTEASLRFAAALGAPSISTEPGGPVPVGMTREEALALFREGLLGAAPLAESLGVRLLIEPEPGLLLTGLPETLSFLDRCPSSALGVNFDAGHFFCEGEDPARMALEFPRALEHIHIEDIARDRVHRHLIPGLGAMDFKAFFDALRFVDYRGFVTVELYPYEEEPERAAERAFEFLKPFLSGKVP